ncbi:MAG: hypothetical protein ACOCVF_00495 [bacterium]
MSINYNRYDPLNTNDNVRLIPFVEIPERTSDKFIRWTESSRMDKLSNKYYGSPFFDFLILQGNPQFVSEFDIPVGEYIRIPFPLKVNKLNYESQLSLSINR